MKSLIFAFALFAPLSFSQEWTQLRGPAGRGHSDATTIPVSFNESDYNWKVPVSGEGYSSPVLWGDRLFLTSATGRETGTRYVHCFDIEDGSEIWKKEFTFTPYHLHKHNSFASSTPTVDAERLYISWTDAGSKRIALALDHHGELLWEVQLGNFSGQHGSGSSPVLYKHILVVPNDGRNEDSFITGLDKTNGKTLWRMERSGSNKACYTMPILYQPEGEAEQLVSINTADGITGYDPLTGKKLWEEALNFGYRTVGSPTQSGHLFFVTGGSGGSGKESAAVRPGTGEKPAETVYKLNRSLPYVPWTLAYKDLIYLWSDGGVLTCVIGATGKTIYTERVGGKYYSSPILIGDKIYCADRDGELVVVQAGPHFKILARNAIGEGMYATPAIHRGVMYLRTHKHLISVGGN